MAPKVATRRPLSRAPKLPFNLGASIAFSERSDSDKNHPNLQLDAGTRKNHIPLSHSLSLLPARLGVGSQQSSSASSSAPRAPLRALMLLSPGPGASPSGFFPGPQPRRLRLRRRLAVLAGARQRQPVPSVGAAATTQRRETARRLGALREWTPLGNPALVRPFRALRRRAPSAPCSEVARSQWSALSGARSGRAAKSVQVGCALPSAPCRSPRLGALTRPAAGHNAQRRRALALESAGRGGASRDRRRGLKDEGGDTGPSEGGTLPLCRRGRAGAYQRGSLKNEGSKAPESRSTESGRVYRIFFPKIKEINIRALLSLGVNQLSLLILSQKGWGVFKKNVKHPSPAGAEDVGGEFQLWIFGHEFG